MSQKIKIVPLVRNPDDITRIMYRRYDALEKHFKELYQYRLTITNNSGEEKQIDILLMMAMKDLNTAVDRITMARCMIEVQNDKEFDTIPYDPNIKRSADILYKSLIGDKKAKETSTDWKECTRPPTCIKTETTC
jgi:hypothetical protein